MWSKKQLLEKNTMNKEELKSIRWFSNGVWQFQPHLFFLTSLYDEKILSETLDKLRNKEIVLVANIYFKLGIN